MEKQTFRKAMSKFATGVTVVTTKLDDEIHGMTVNAFMSVSLDPMLVTISLDKKTHLCQNADKMKRLGISILREEQQEISMIFAKQIDKKFEDFTTLDDVPVINGALTTLACTVQNRVEAGDHELIIAEVDEIVLGEGKPILYFDSAYQSIEKK
ncbi:flavin reductase family protein [Saliterribacillus persicus]|uniref:Flavin reductase (DIM6/NTAB) family NADH-FMN oxidoreductase RutF n=1 Tax=Saliterribacillus persicus TaxID=930114 RepID=A0A368YCQ9_9BACI|nr:flavin reductase family protein [Saliterribacillus persicus]RCW77218.1 flavin reductase (DIM6/NTAB) family NADH-FMN oxidoreductase RutF [Saliterribacillus persicus]